jgi:hypothetical protein
MLRLPRLRPLSVLLAAVYIAIPGGASGVRACAHHDAAGVEQDHGVPGDAGHSHHGEAPATSAPETESEPHGGCSCLDACAAAAAVALPSPGITGTAATDHTLSTGYAAADSPHVSRPDHFLPYPHGPPANPS